MLNIDLEQFFKLFKKDDYRHVLGLVQAGLENLFNRKGPGNDFLGWIDLPEKSKNDIPVMKEISDEIRAQNACLVCIGIGGSYLGARAVISALKPQNRNILFSGYNLCSDDLHALLQYLETRDEVYLNVISKSGTTTEPGIAFRILRDWMKRRYGKKASNRIIATTDASRGALRELAGAEKYRRFIIPDDVGGRFSVLSPVGLFPIACAGIDPESLLNGAAQIKQSCLSEDADNNPALQYAAARFLAYSHGKAIEILATFDSKLRTVTEWWKQLFGESEGKEGKSLFPASAEFTTDLHSLGQWIQDGSRNILETFLFVEKSNETVFIPKDSENRDNLNYLEGKDLDYINRMAYRGVQEAHTSGGTPNLSILLRKITEESIGALLYFFEISVALSAYALGVNPFNQPGVEAYKTNMFRLLGKPGFELNHRR